MKRLNLWIGGTLAFLLLLGLLGLLFADTVITRAINESGHRLLDVESRVESARLSLFKRTLTLSGIELKNPEGFETPRMVYLEQISLRVDPASLWGDCIRIREVEIRGADLTYETVGFGRSNLSMFVKSLRDRLRGGASLLGPGDDGRRKTLSIERLSVAGGRVTLSAAFSRSEGVVLPVPPIELRDIGGDCNMGVSEAVAEVLRRLGHAALSTVDQGDGTP
jgi:hypothetical protein